MTPQNRPYSYSCSAARGERGESTLTGAPSQGGLGGDIRVSPLRGLRDPNRETTGEVGSEGRLSVFSDPVFQELHDAEYRPEPYIARPSARYLSRSHAFCMAYDLFQTLKESVSACTLEPYQALGQIELLFSRWLLRYQSTFIKLVNREEKRAILTRALCRFMAAYKKRLWKRYGFLDIIRWDKMLTLTVDPAAFSSFSEEYEAILKGWDKLRAALRKEFGDFTFVRVLEIQKTGRPHLHILIHGITRYVPIWWIRHLWSKYGIGLECHIGEVKRKDLRGLCYVMKYIKKTVSSERDSLYASLLFASNRRQWGFSIGRRLKKAANINLDNTTRLTRTRSGWDFEGFCHQNDVVCLCCQSRIPYEDSIFLRDVDFKDWPRVFGNTHTKNGLGAMRNTTGLVFRHGDKSQLLSGLG